jgi:hypothetical protein
LIYTTSRFGVIGAGCAWFVANLTYFLLWVPVVHRRFKANLHSAWITRDVGLPLLVTMTVGIVVRNIVTWPQNRWLVAAMLVCIGIVLVISAFLASGAIRERIPLGFLRRPKQI